MLLLTPRPGETIHIGNNIEVKITMIIGHQAWLEVIAPDNLHIHKKSYSPSPDIEAIIR